MKLYWNAVEWFYFSEGNLMNGMSQMYRSSIKFVEQRREERYFPFWCLVSILLIDFRCVHKAQRDLSFFHLLRGSGSKVTWGDKQSHLNFHLLPISSKLKSCLSVLISFYLQLWQWFWSEQLNFYDFPSQSGCCIHWWFQLP